jgi:hypothetical protein
MTRRATVIMAVPDLAAFEAVIKTQATADAMAHVGERPETLVLLLESPAQ